jgi:hypothetical protein
MSQHLTQRASHESHRYFCVANTSKDCQVYVNGKRASFLIEQSKPLTCHKCGDAIAVAKSKRKASMVQIPYSKGAYQYIHNPDELRFTNPKRTT